MIKFVNIYDMYGCVTDVIALPEDVEWIEGRISLGRSGAYYKGSGTNYSFHYSLDRPQQSDLISGSFLPGGIRAVNPFLCNKFGIFSVPHSPMFSEFIGGCGVREKKIVEYSQAFERSDVEVVDKVDIPNINHSIYGVVYKGARCKFQDDPIPEKLLDLIHYMLDSHWNCPWNKNSVSDITPDGMVTDVADLFQSTEFNHKAGTVYSMVSSLYRNNFSGYQALKKTIGHKVAFTDLGVMDTFLQGITDDCLVLTISILAQKYPVSVDLPLTKRCIRDFALEYIVSGHNFGYGEKQQWGDAIKQAFTNKLLEVSVD